MTTVDIQRLQQAYERAAKQLREARDGACHWTGELSTSALSTATAISALALARTGTASHHQLIERGLAWLMDHQNADGGWGDTDRSHSNIATTMLVKAACHLAQAERQFAAALERGDAYLARQGGVAGLRKRYGRDKTFAVPILTNTALAGLVSWSEVSALPFECAALPANWYRLVRMPVVSYAIPALVAIGQAKFFHQPPWFWPLRWLRRLAIAPTMNVLRRMQPDSGGYLEAIPLTSFVVMSLAATGRVAHAVTQHGLKFIEDSVRPDGSWPIDTNLATWNTSLAINALSARDDHWREELTQAEDCLEWLLKCQNRAVHPFTNAEPGGWGWSDLSGAVPDADDTPAALLALAAWQRTFAASPASQARTAAMNERVMAAVDLGLRWLLSLQNRDGGWPTFCRGWGKLPFDRSGSDLTAHGLRAIRAWINSPALRSLQPQLQAAADRGFAYLARQQRPDGSWLPLWFGNQDHPQEENPVYGSAKVLLAYQAWNRSAEAGSRRGIAWLRAARQTDGSWGSVEETALAVETLAGADDAVTDPALAAGLDWLAQTVETDGHLVSAPIGFYFAKLWYYERLYPLTFTVAALGRALRLHQARPDSSADRHPPVVNSQQPQG
jgi:squalene-hopene/tetraprenyl-beta-curcumene cyclase